MNTWTKEKRKEYDKNRWQRYSQEAGQQKKDRRLAIKKWYKEYKSGLKCSRCPENHPACIEFHHLRDKKYEVSYMVSRGMSIKNILSEMEKCEVICANCHAKHHWTS